MKRLLSIVLSLILCLQTVSLLPVRSQAEESQIMLSQSDFTALGGTWSYDAGKVLLNSCDASVPWPKYIARGEYTNYTIEADMVGVKEGGFVFRTHNETTAADGFGGYFIGYDSNYAFAGIDNSGWSTVSFGGLEANASARLEYRENAHWKVVVSGNTFTLFVDDMAKPVIQVCDETYTSGGFGIRLRYRDGEDPGHVENLKVTPIADSEATYTDMSEGTYDRWIKRLIAQNPAADNQGRFICTGASHIEFWDDLKEDFEPIEALNFGMGGSQISHLIGHTKELIADYNPSGILLFTGGNDWAAGVSMSDIKTRYTALIDEIRTQMPDVPVFFASGITPRPSRSTEADMAFIAEVNAYVRELCSTDSNMYYIGAETYLEYSDGTVNPSLFRDDRIHFNEEGYDRVAAVIVKKVMEVMRPDYLAEHPIEDPVIDDPPTAAVISPYEVYTDDFSADTISNYRVAGPDNGAWGNWKIADGILSVTGNPGAHWWGSSILLDGVRYEDFIMEFDVEATTGYGVILRAQDDARTPGSGLNKWFSGNACVVMLWDPSNDNARAEIQDYDGTPASLAKISDVGMMKNTHWKITADGSSISFEITDSSDAAHKVEYTLTDLKYRSGLVGFYNLVGEGYTSMKVDNLSITPINVMPVYDIAWEDDFEKQKGAAYTAYGLWWNDAVSLGSGADYGGYLANEGGSGAGLTYYYLNDYEFIDLTMEFDVVSVKPGAQYGVVLRAGDPGPGADQADGYTVMYDGSWIFAGKLDGSFTQLTETPGRYAYNPSNDGVTPSHWKVTVSGSLISLYLNDSTEPAIQVTDSAFREGLVGFRAFAPAGSIGNVIIDNLKISGTSHSEPRVPTDPDIPPGPVIPEKPELGGLFDEKDVIRSSGAGRYDTAIATADKLKQALGKESFDTIIIASGSGSGASGKFPDALAGSYLAAVKGAPILMVGADGSASDKALAYVSANLESGGKVYLLGGTGAVPAGIESSLKSMGVTAVRLSGPNRYATNLSILAEAGVADGADLLIADGANFADALSASALGKPILLTDKRSAALTADQKAFISGRNFAHIYILGGTGAVPEALENEIRSLAGGTEVKRLKGSGRYETSAAIAAEFFADAKCVTLATGENFPDGLTGGALAYALGAPLLLTSNRQFGAAAEYVASRCITKVLVFGGSGAISDDAIASITAK